MLLKPNESESEKNKKYKYSRHHILPRSRRWANVNDNIEILRDNYHRALHTLFANQTIAEQLITTVNLSEKALREDVKQRLLETLSQRDINDPYEWYDDKVIL
jgi:hypothetical protein